MTDRYEFRKFCISLFVVSLFLTAILHSPDAAGSESVKIIDTLRAEARYEEALAKARTVQTKLAADTEAAGWEQADSARLVATLQRVAALSEAGRLELSRADQLGKEHRSAFADYSVPKAISLAKTQYGIRRKILGKDHQETAASLVALSEYLILKPDVVKAEEDAREALSIQRRVLGNEHPAVGRTLRILGHILEEMDRFDEAVSVAKESLRLAELNFGSDNPETASALVDLGRALVSLGKREELLTAIQHLDRALEIHRTRGMEAEIARNLHWKSKALFSSYEIEKAETVGKESLLIRRRVLGNDHMDVAHSLHLLAEIYVAQRFFQDATRDTKEATAIQRNLLGETHPLTLFGTHNLAVIEMSQGHFAEAEPLLRKVLAGERRDLGNDHPDVSYTLSTLGINLSEQGRYQEAQPYYREALDILLRIDENHPEIRWVIDYMARDAVKRGDHATAEKLYNQVREIHRRKTGMEHSGMLVRIAESRFTRGDLKGAESHLVEAVQAYEAHLKLRKPDAIKAAAVAGAPRPLLALVQLELGKHREAWETLETARGRALTELLSSRFGPAGGKVSGGSEGAFRFPLGRIQQSLGKHEAIVGWLDRQIGKERSSFWAYLIRDKGAVIWDRVTFPNSSTSSELEKRFTAFGEALSGFGSSALGPDDPGRLDPEAKILWRGRFGPLARHLDGIDRLIVVPSELMSGVSVGALLSPDGRTVDSRFSISYAPSATVYTWLHERSRPASRSRTALLVGDPPFREAHLAAMQPRQASRGSERIERSVMRDALSGNRAALRSLPRLRWSRDEVINIAKLFPNHSVLVGKNASEAVLSELADGKLGSFAVLHFATHALIDRQRPNCSALVLSQLDPAPDGGNPCESPTTDGLLMGEEIGRSWQLDAELVTLSACDTALGRKIDSEGVIGFAYPFFAAGTRSLLVSQWKVDDQATALFMGRFYREWLGDEKDTASGASGKSKAAALQATRQWLREYKNSKGDRPYEHPYYWAAFILIGSGSQF